MQTLIQTGVYRGEQISWAYYNRHTRNKINRRNKSVAANEKLEDEHHILIIAKAFEYGSNKQQRSADSKFLLRGAEQLNEVMRS